MSKVKDLPSKTTAADDDVLYIVDDAAGVNGGRKIKVSDFKADTQLSASEIKTQYESNADTNAFTDAEKAKLAGIEASKFLGEYVSLAALQTAHPSPVVGSYANVDAGFGNDVERYVWDETDSKYVLQLGESTALTDAQIKTQYENNADTNAFTDAEQTKLAGIEAEAEVNQTDSEIKAQYEANADTNAFTDAEKADVAKINTIESDLTDHLNGSINKHDASEIDYERLDGDKVDIQASSDDVEDAITDLDDNKLSRSGVQSMTGNLNMDNNDIVDPASVCMKSDQTAPAHLEGKVFYDKDNHTLAVYNDQSTVTHQLGQEHLIRVFNDSGSIIGNGIPVYVSGTEEVEFRATIAPAKADNEVTAKVIGITTQPIPNNSFGYITRLGAVNGINTAAFTDGDAIYLSADTAGAITNTPPAQGNFEILLGYVAHADPVSGVILADIVTSLSSGVGDSDSLVFTALKGTVGTLTSGTPVYISGYNGVASLSEVEAADASNASQMPALGIVRTTLTDSQAGTIQVFGKLQNIDTSSFSVGDEIYVGDIAGTLTNVRPDGTDLVQKIAVVTKVGVTDGSLEVVGAGRTNALPNIAQNNIWRGDINGIPEEVDFDVEVANNSAVTANTAKVSADGSVTTHSDVTDAGSGAIITSAERSKLAGIETGATADQNANEVPYNNATSGLAAIEVQAAIDEVEGRVDTAESTLSSHLDGGTSKHDATEIDYERVDGSKVDIQAASDSVESAITDLDDNKLSRNGNNTMAANLDMGSNNITNVGTVDGRDVSVDGAKLDKFDHGYLQYVNNGVLTTTSTTFVDVALATDIGSFPNSLFTKVDTSTFRADFTGRVRITLQATSRTDTNDRATEFAVRLNATDLEYSKFQSTTKNTNTRQQSGSVSFILSVTNGDTIKARFRSPEGDTVNIQDQRCMMIVEVYNK